MKAQKRDAADSRARLVEATARLMRIQGYHATGLNQIVEESKAPKGSLYHYFPKGKEELALEALRTAGQAMLEKLRNLYDAYPMGQALDLLVESTLQELEESGYEKGCPVATVALETAAYPGAIQQLCAGIYEEFVVLIQDRLVRVGVPPEKARETAMMALAAYEGGLLLSRAKRSPEPLRVVAEQIKLYTQAALR